MSKQLLFNEEARRKLKEGVDIAANAVKITLGPKGRNVVIARPHKGEPDVVNDGATIVRNIAIKDPFQEQGVQLVKSVAIKTESTAGDGTTTSAILAQAIVNSGLRAISNGANPVLLKKGIEMAVDATVKFLKERAIEVKPKELSRIANMSAEDEQIGNTISEVFTKYGKDVAISVEDSEIPGIHYDMIEGYKFERGWASPYFINRPERFETAIEDAYVVILDRKLTVANDIVHLIKTVKEQGVNELVIIAEEITGDALATLVINRVKGIFVGLAINAPGFGKQRADLLDDMAMFTGATKISAEMGMRMEDIKIEMFGKCKVVISNREETALIGGAGSQEEIEERVKQLEFLLEQNKDGGTEYFEKQLKERIGKLTGKAAILKIGYDSKAEATYKKLKIEDTIAATRAALEEGILPGGGTQYLWASKSLPIKLEGENPDVQLGIKIVAEALREPVKQLALNSGLNPDSVIDKIFSTGDIQESITMGFNVLTGEYVNLLEAGIVDPLKVERMAISNAASVAKTLLTADVVIVDEPEEKK